MTEKSASAAREIFSLFRSRDGTISGKRDCYKAERIKVFIEKGSESKMKIDRMIGILSILLQQEKVTAPYLAEKFEVSRRTINRDIEDLCRAGGFSVDISYPSAGICHQGRV